MNHNDQNGLEQAHTVIFFSKSLIDPELQQSLKKNY